MTGDLPVPSARISNAQGQIQCFHTYLTHRLVILDQRMYCLDRQESTVIHARCLVVGREYIWGDHGGKVMSIHLASRLLVDMREGRYPVQEREEYFQ